jgi:hypothetical protein
MTNEPELVTVKLRMLKINLDRIAGAAAVNGESVQDAINRACAFYEAFSLVSRFTKVRWTDVSGVEHKALIYK